MSETRPDFSWLPGLAQRLRAAGTDWREAGLRQLAGELGWEWKDAPGGPLLRTELPGAAPARLRPVDALEKDYVHDGEEYLGLYIPLVPHDEERGPAGCADAFRAAGRALRDALGPASVMGAYGFPMPFFDSPPVWGSPFLRWRGRDTSLELHPSQDGPELLLMPTGPQENWHWRISQGEPGELGGFFGVRNADPANAGLGIPGGWRTDDWDTFRRALGDFLHTLPAETRALGTVIDFALHGRIPGAGGPMLCNISSGDTLEIAHFTWTTEHVTDLGAEAMRRLGWTPAEEQAATREHWDPVDHVVGPFQPGESDGAATAGVLVDYLRAVGVPSPAHLLLSDSAQEVDGYWVDYFGLTLEQPSS